MRCSGAADGDGEVSAPRLHPGQPLDESSRGTARRVSSTEQVLLGHTGIRVSRLAMRSGTPDCVDAFTIGFKSRAELGSVQTKIENA